MKKLLILTLLLASLGSAHGLVGFGESNIFTIIVPTLPVELSSLLPRLQSRTLFQ